MESVRVLADAVEGDRIWALRDEERQELITGRRCKEVMLCTARLLSEGSAHVEITLPDGQRARSDDPDIHQQLTLALKRKVTLWPLQPESDVAHYRTAGKPNEQDLRDQFFIAPGEPLPDFSALPLGMLRELSRYATPRGKYYDAYPVHVLTEASLEAMRAQQPGVDFDVRRFRPNFLLACNDREGQVEAAWPGGTLALGAARLQVEGRTVRCVMPTRSQPGLPVEPRVMKTVAAHAERHLGVYASVRHAETVRVGDRVFFRATPALARWVDARAIQARRLVLSVAAKLIDDEPSAGSRSRS